MEAYTFTFKSSLIWYGYKNSILITFFGTIYNMILTVLCAYALTKPIPGGKFIRFAIVFTMYFSGGLIPSYLLIKDLKLMDTIASMILPTGINIMYMLIISNYFKSLPPALEESAKIDGATDLRILWASSCRCPCRCWRPLPSITRWSAGTSGIWRCCTSSPCRSGRFRTCCAPSSMTST